jgi:hypothetical protein
MNAVMKNLLFFLSCIICLFIPQQLEAQAQKGSDYKTVDHANIAVFIIDYPDTKDTIRKLYPSAAEIRQEIFDSTRFIQRYFKTMSYGKFKLTGDVFGPFTHQDPITASNNYQMAPYETISTITIPGFQYSLYTHFIFISYNDWNPGGGCSYIKAQRTVTINGTKYIIPDFSRMVLAIGPYQRNPSHGFSNHFIDKFMTQIFVPLDEKPNGEYFFSNYTGLTTFQRVFLHEFCHILGIWSHANSSTNGSGFPFETEITGNYDFLNLQYGNKTDMMGDCQWGTSLNGGYRDLLGWTENTNRIKLTTYTKQRIRLYPINQKNGYRICEIRIPYKYYIRTADDINNYPQEGRKNMGYFLEVRNADAWDSTLNHTAIKANTSGIILLRTDGWTTYLVDASPSGNLKYDWGSQPDLRDVALKPGMRYSDQHVCFSHVEKNSDGSYSVDIEVLDPAVTPSKTSLCSSSVNQTMNNSITLTWFETLHNETYYIQISKDQSFGTVVKTDSTRVDTSKVIAGLENNTKYYWRVRGKNSAGYGEWSDAGSFTATFVGLEKENAIPAENLLLQNYPNPFHVSTTIKYTVPLKSHAQLTVFDAVGKKITHLVNEEKNPGIYEAKFDAGALPAGIFFYELKSGAYVRTGKMIKM